MKKLTLDDTLSEIEERWKPLELKEADVNADGRPTQIASTLDSLQELRVRVAELCGWELIEVRPVRLTLEGYRGKSSKREFVPDYCNDLNACSEFENTLTAKWRPIYFEVICVDLGIPEGALGDMTAEQIMSIVTATAEQRCRAFVAVMKASVPSSDADSVSDVTKSDDASRASSPKDSFSPEIVIPALCKAVRECMKLIEALEPANKGRSDISIGLEKRAIASILEKKDA